MPCYEFLSYFHDDRFITQDTFAILYRCHQLTSLSFSVNILSFIVGTSLTWSSPMLPQLNDTSKTVFDDVPTQDEQSWIGSLLALGAIFGPPLSGFLAGAIGRKWTMMFLAVPFLIAYIIMAFAKQLVAFYVARILCGISVGGVFTVSPMYIGEVATHENRGALGSLFSGKNEDSSNCGSFGTHMFLYIFL